MFTTILSQVMYSIQVLKKEFDGVTELFENVARLWAYGDGANTIGYDAIQRQLRPAQTA